MKRGKDNAILSNTLAVSPLPLFPFEWFYVLSERVIPHLSQMLEYDFLAVWRKSFKLSFGFFCQPNAPIHFRVFQEWCTRLDEFVLLPSVTAFPLQGSIYHPSQRAFWA